MGCASGRWANGKEQNRYVELTLWQTKGGSFVCQRWYRTLWQGERDAFTVAVVSDHAGVIAYFGHDDLAKSLYQEAGIECVERVE